MKPYFLKNLYCLKYTGLLALLLGGCDSGSSGNSSSQVRADIEVQGEVQQVFIFSGGNVTISESDATTVDVRLRSNGVAISLGDNDSITAGFKGEIKGLTPGSGFLSPTTSNYSTFFNTISDGADTMTVSYSRSNGRSFSTDIEMPASFIMESPLTFDSYFEDEIVDITWNPTVPGGQMELHRFIVCNGMPGTSAESLSDVSIIDDDGSAPLGLGEIAQLFRDKVAGTGFTINPDNECGLAVELYRTLQITDFTGFTESSDINSQFIDRASGITLILNL